MYSNSIFSLFADRKLFLLPKENIEKVLNGVLCTCDVLGCMK